MAHVKTANEANGLRPTLSAERYPTTAIINHVYVAELISD